MVKGYLPIITTSEDGGTDAGDVTSWLLIDLCGTPLSAAELEKSRERCGKYWTCLYNKRRVKIDIFLICI